MVFDELAILGWRLTLLKIADKLSTVAASNLLPFDGSLSSRVRRWLRDRREQSES
ncbi:hypothetical protein [Bradyrhizobium sp. ARR65]|uniref:hypothetical protein n=1 Tax=Bradyrhizobium sp. ARR65 TaxID=1040989 RepID=UPI000A88444A|nr:hypothetical protein [Bradyrhizobium sp. ARR65]